ncbi:MAG: SDR family oxidoreductase [Gemmatimonadales bacterium]
MTRYLVTGGAGFIGSNVASALLARGDTVRVLDNFSTGLRTNLTPLEGAEIVEGDIRSYHIVQEAMEGVDFVLHQAALPSVPRSVRDPITSNDVNVVGTLNVLTAARDAKVKRLVYAGSSSVYGRTPGLPKRESMPPSPISPYAVSKLAGEHYCQSFTELYGFETVILRYFNVFGPRQNPKSEYAAVVPKFIHMVMHGEPPTINGDGSQTRDFTYVENVVQANLLAAVKEGVAGRVFNIATGQQVALLEMLHLVERLVGKKVEPFFQPRRSGDVEHSLAAIDEARTKLGYVPTVSLEEGLRRTVEAVRLELGEGAAVA